MGFQRGPDDVLARLTPGRLAVLERLAAAGEVWLQDGADRQWCLHNGLIESTSRQNGLMRYKLTAFGRKALDQQDAA